MTIINLTPHPLVLEIQRAEEPMSDDRTYQTIESSGIARCEATETEVAVIEGIPVVTTQFGAVTGLPASRFVCGEELGAATRPFAAIYVVSSITAQAVPDRRDVFVPARPVRDEKGRIIACRALGRISK